LRDIGVLVERDILVRSLEGDVLGASLSKSASAGSVCSNPVTKRKKDFRSLPRELRIFT